MKKCRIYHTGVYSYADGFIKDGLVYFQGNDKKLYFPKDMFLAIEECEGGLIQFEVEGKWGFANIYTGEIKIEPVWDYAGPVYYGYAQVSLGSKVEHCSNGYVMVQGGKHGYIDSNGKIIIPLEYDDVSSKSYNTNYFQVAKDEKWGTVDKQNRIIVPLEWDSMQRIYGGYYNIKNRACNIVYFEVEKNGKLGIVDSQNHILIAVEWDFMKIQREGLIFAGKKQHCEPHATTEEILLAIISNTLESPNYNPPQKWGVFDQNFNEIVKAELDECPVVYNTKCQDYILRKGRKYGVLSKEGQLISDTVLFKKEAIGLMANLLCNRFGI